MNALTRHDAAIVTAQPGTTRDLLRERINLEGVPVTLIDTAGLRDATEEIEAEGIRRAREAIKTAETVLYLVDCSDEAAIAAASEEVAHLGRDAPTIVVYTKSDLDPGPDSAQMSISVTTGAGIEALKRRLLTLLGRVSTEESLFSARRRHLDALRLASEHIDMAFHQAEETNTDLFAEELRLAQDALGQIIGKISSDELLGRIFSTFCIGK